MQITRPSIRPLLVLLAATTLTNLSSAQSHRLDEMSLERWAKMREVERHQMQIAEKYYRERSYKVAADEYDKYITLYENSDAASHALLKWSLCTVYLRKQNTAINDGFRSVIDYWPDSEDAIAAGYYIGQTYKEIGQLKKAKPALADVIESHTKHAAAVFAMSLLAEIAEIEKDEKARLDLWRKLTFDATRGKYTSSACTKASIQLASHLFANGGFEEGVDALKTTYNETQIDAQVVSRARSALSVLINNSETQSSGERLTGEIVEYLRSREPEDISSDESKLAAIALNYYIADVYLTAKQDAKVLETYRQISNRFGTDDQLLGRTASFYRGKKEYDKARAAYRKYENQIEGLSQIAMTYRDEQDMENAVATYSKLSAEDSENSFRWMGEQAATYRQFQKYEPAIEVYGQLMTQDIEHSGDWLWATATAYRDWKKYKEAIGFFRQSERFPDNYREMAWCHRRLKQQKEAVVLYNQIAGGHKQSAPWAMTEIGYTEEEAGNKDKAITAFKRVCKLFPKDRYASVAHAHLQNKYKLSVTLGGAKED